MSLTNSRWAQSGRFGLLHDVTVPEATEAAALGATVVLCGPGVCVIGRDKAANLFPPPFAADPAVRRERDSDPAAAFRGEACRKQDMLQLSK
jgi:hypothetical protein